MWVTKLLISPLKKRIFLPKNDQIWSKIGISVHCWLIWCPVGGLAGGCGAGCISQDTYYFILVKCPMNLNLLIKKMKIGPPTCIVGCAPSHPRFSPSSSVLDRPPDYKVTKLEKHKHKIMLVANKNTVLYFPEPRLSPAQ